MKVTLVRVGIALVAVLLAACVSMEAPKTFNEKLAYAYAGVASARDNAVNLLQRGRISKEEAKQAQAIADQIRAALDLSKGTSKAGDLTTAQGQLNAALAALTQLEATLKARQ